MTRITNIDRYQRIITLRGEGKTFQEIADIIGGVSRQRIFQIHERARKRIAKHTMPGNHRTRQTQAA
jgi:DNA-directed RNA polymerase specialized sigma subunit